MTKELRAPRSRRQARLERAADYVAQNFGALSQMDSDTRAAFREVTAKRFDIPWKEIDRAFFDYYLMNAHPDDKEPTR